MARALHEEEKSSSEEDWDAGGHCSKHGGNSFIYGLLAFCYISFFYLVSSLGDSFCLD